MKITRDQQMRAAEEMFKQLDQKDGKKADNKIEASVWNKFVKEIAGTGKEIKTGIDKENALKSIRTYLARQNADEELLKKWNEGIKGMEIEKGNGIGNTMPPSIDDKKPVEKPLTAAEAKEARAYGSNVSDYLVGYTTDAEEGLTREVLTKHVNNKNVMEFLRGYESNKCLGNHYFRQLHTESGFGDVNWNQQDAMVDTANKVLAYMKKNGASNTDIKEVSIILKDHSFTLQEADKMDRIVAKYLPPEV